MQKRLYRLDMQMTTSLMYDPDTYDDIPTYQWDERFSIDSFARTIDRYNDELWYTVRRAICGKLGIPFKHGGCKLPLSVSIGQNVRLKTSPCDVRPYNDSTFKARS